MAHWLLYGGTFDPIHHGHLLTARAAREVLGADGVLLIPAGVSPHKTAAAATATGEQRLRMLQLAIENEPGFAIDDRELNRPGPSYTYDTVDQLAAERPSDTFTLLMGADQLAKLPTWHRIGELLTLAKLAILPRLGNPVVDAIELAVKLKIPAEKFTLLRTPLIEISATQIRERIRQGLPIRWLVPEAVGNHIVVAGLYRF